MKKFIMSNLLLLLIVALAAIFRFWGLATTPPSMYWDEVSQGYNTYSILTTGHDEHNEFMPIARFIAFGDYKAPVYIYLDVPFMAILGKNTLAVRFPSALLGTLTVFVAYGLVMEMFSEYKKKKTLALSTAFLLSISPWHVQLSRAAYEGNIATFFTVLGIYLFFLAKNRNYYWLFASAVSFVFGFYAFTAHRIFIPLLVIVLALFYFKEVFSQKRLIITIGSVVVAILLLLPFLLYLRTPESRLRFNEVNIFTDSSIVDQSNQWTKEDNNSKLAHVLHNRRILFTFSYLKHYFDFFNPDYLFFTGDINPRFSMRDSGELYLWELPLLLIGAYFLIKYRKKESAFVFVWFLLAPVAAATARETPHALRSETYIPTYEMIAAFGVVAGLAFVESIKKAYKNAIYAVAGLIVLATVVTGVHNYFSHFPKLYSYDWQYGYQQAVEYTQSVASKYDSIAFTQTYGRPYIYVLFYGNISPQTYWKEGNVKRDVFGFYNVLGVGKYQFRDQLVEPVDAGRKVLYVGDPKQIPSNLKVLKTIDFLNGEPAFVIATNS
ncbi:MAG: phospholipid carrier-dependent glycosyltransferase [Patescibacteria group bacterium]|nr:phospholipid carrier-dependent glycosyltransferase [Patescibacteria group bacterium]